MARDRSGADWTAASRRHRHGHRRLMLLCGILIGMVMMALIVRQNESVINSSLGPEPPAPAVVTSANGTIINYKHVASLNQSQIDTAAHTVYGVVDPVPASDGIETYDISYVSRLPQSEKPITIHARFYLPVSSAAAPAYIYGPGTTGPGVDCAPTLETAKNKNWGHYDDHMEYYAGQGFAVALVDYYRGSGEAPIHPYFVGEVEGRVMLDAAIALRNFRDTEQSGLAAVGEASFFGGYSQGAHAALWSEQLATQYAPSVHVAGIIGYAAATDVVRSVSDISRGSTTIWLPPYVYAAYENNYGDLEPANTIFKEPFASSVEHDARSFCIDQLEVRTGHYGPPSNANNVFTPEFLQAAKDNTLAISFPKFFHLMNQNLAGNSSDHTPVLLIAGMKDVVILPQAQVELAHRICASPLANVQLLESPNGTHYTAMAEGHKTAVDWMHTILSGGTTVNNCEQYR